MDPDWWEWVTRSGPLKVMLTHASNVPSLLPGWLSCDTVLLCDGHSTFLSLSVVMG